ncbi:ABC transporter ATP-binding protein [Cellulomonas sp.]|uniref:ATP-binding cassette domain-containing protein n=1 Tax=Cellulomonas sp. TaxID=40001 RepID=UPI0025869EBE|nr:ABC transporter ATP-binding protein [Cellulomonas sp.]MCR6688097.1 ABC transporter ATP-binding protein [Cellulomonas sp.]
MNDEVAVQTHDLRVLRGMREIGPLSLVARRGEAVALVGPNGCGKTTLLLAMLGLISTSGGRAEIFGQVPAPANPPQRTAYLPDRPVFWESSSGPANLRPFATGPDQVPAALERVGLSSTSRVPVRAYSRGMKQRLGLARVLVAQPQLLVLDEPTIAVDDSGVGALADTLSELVQNGAAVVVSTHDAHFVDRLGARVHQLAAS